MNKDNVEHVDFGKGLRESQRKFSRLLHLCEEQERELARDPGPFLDHASEEITKRDRVLEKASDSLLSVPYSYKPESSIPNLMETVVVRADEYERLKACAEIIEEWASRNPEQ